MLRRVDAENRLQTLKEELDFQKNIYSEVGPAGPRCRGQVLAGPTLGAEAQLCAGSLMQEDGHGDGQHPAPQSQWGWLMG